MASKGRIVHFEMHQPDMEKAAAFYEKTFGWSFQKWEGPEPYWLVSTGDKESAGIDGGMMASRDGQPRTVNVIEVDDIDAMAKSVESNGGTIVVPKMPIPGVGWVAYFTDPGGNIVGIYKTDPNAG